MGRLVNGERKIDIQRPEYAGKLLIFCEGHTEYNYLNYFRKYLQYNLRAPYADIILEYVNVGGNAKKVFDAAEDFLKNDGNRSKYQNYEKHLVFDCDAPENIQEVISLMKSSENEYVLDYSVLLFETWLVMHFQDVWPGQETGKRKIIKYIREYLGVPKYTSGIKADEGTIGKILGNDGNEKIRAAIKNARGLEQYWETRGYSAYQDIRKMNPSVKIYELVERLLEAIEFLC